MSSRGSLHSQSQEGRREQYRKKGHETVILTVDLNLVYVVTACVVFVFLVRLETEKNIVLLFHVESIILNFKTLKRTIAQFNLK